MLIEPHLTAEQFARYQDRTLEPADLLAVDLHLAACGQCRDVLCHRAGAEAQSSGLRFLLTEHLSYEQVAACAEGAGDRAAWDHLAECESCREEVADLARFARKVKVVAMPARRSPWVAAGWAAAAAVVVIAGLAVWRGSAPAGRSAPAPVAEVKPSLPAEPALSAEQQSALDAVRAGRRFARAKVLDRLAARRGVLLGEPGEAKTFDLTAPLSVAVVSDRPTFRWQPLAGASAYVVSVFDEDFRKVAESPAVNATEWQPESALPRGKVYAWQVSATVAGATVRAPVPPAPEARFQVATGDDAAAIEQARRVHPANHLLLATLYAQAGALDEAAAEVDALAATDPQTAAALRRSLAELRGK